MKKPLILATLLALAVLAGLTLWDGPRDLDGLRATLAGFEAMRAANPLALAALAFGLYVLVVALSLPFAVWLTLGIGALFGFWAGLVIVSFASTIGATLAFLAARYLLRDWVQARFGDRLAGINRGLERDGPFYLFTLRLIPVVPFFAVNLLMGLTPIRARTFYWVSQLGMLAGTAVFVNAGTQLAQIDSLSGILSPALLAVFRGAGGVSLGRALDRGTGAGAQGLCALDAAPAVRPQPDRDRRGRGGLVSAYIAAATKAKVTLIESHQMGGDCLNYGCVPSKALIRSAKVAHLMRDAGRFGIAPVAPQVDFKTVMGRVHQVIADIEPHDSVERYTGLGVEVLQGYARLIDPWTVETSFPDGRKERLTSRAIVLATGAAPFMPPLPGLDTVGALNSDTLWEALKTRPEAPQTPCRAGRWPHRLRIGAGVSASGVSGDAGGNGPASFGPRRPRGVAGRAGGFAG
jgi:uncharacterized membrane protein YdjX (TVP38/TMEM64 family)